MYEVAEKGRLREMICLAADGFPDVHNLTGQLLEHNARLVETCCFLRRGDFPRNQSMNEMPEVFYEWAYVIEKTEGYTTGRI